MKISNDVQAVIYKDDSDDLRFLVLCRFDKDRNENHFRLVKGGLKKEEEAEEVLEREIGEETGINNILEGLMK